MPFNFKIPLRFLRGSYAQLSLTIVALACGVALVCAFDLVNRAVLRAFVEVIDTMAGRAALQVTAGDGGLFPEALAAAIAIVPGVEFAVPVISATAFVADDGGELLTVHGVDITNETAVRVYDARDKGGIELDDPLEFLNQPDSVVLTRTFAARRSLRVGDRIALMTASGRLTLTVRGLLEPEGVARIYGGNLAVMDLYSAEVAFASPGFINRIDVVVKQGQEIGQVAPAIAAALPSGLHVEAPVQRKADLNKVMQSLQVMLQAVGLVGLVVAFLIAFSRLTAVFEGRAWQLGILRAGGLRQRAVWRELLKEGLILGAAGAGLGVPLGVGIAHVLLPIVATTTALNYKLVAPEAGLSLRLSSLVLGTALGLTAALLAAALPAWRAVRVAVVETIRARGTEQGGMGGKLMWSVRALVAGGVAVAIILQSVTGSAVWGLVATGLIAAGTALAAQPILRLIETSLQSVLRGIAGPTGRFVSALFTYRTRRISLTVAMLAVGLGSIVWLQTVAHSFEKSLAGALSQALRGDVVVTSAHIASGYLEAPVSEQLAAEISHLRGIQDVAAERLTDWHFGGGPIAIDAFDPRYFLSPEFGQWPLLGAHVNDVWAAVAKGEAVLISSSLERNLGVRVNDAMTLETPNGLLNVRVGGVTTNFTSPRGTIIMSRALFRNSWNDAQVNRVFVRIAPGVNVVNVRAMIARELGKKYGLRILSSSELLDYFAMQVRRAFAPVNVLAGLVLLVVLVGTADTLAAGVLERTRELGTMRAVGVRRRLLRRMVVTEALVIGTLGLRAFGVAPLIAASMMTGIAADGRDTASWTWPAARPNACWRSRGER